MDLYKACPTGTDIIVFNVYRSPTYKPSTNVLGPFVKRGKLIVIFDNDVKTRLMLDNVGVGIHDYIEIISDYVNDVSERIVTLRIIFPLGAPMIMPSSEVEHKLQLLVDGKEHSWRFYQDDYMIPSVLIPSVRVVKSRWVSGVLCAEKIEVSAIIHNAVGKFCNTYDIVTMTGCLEPLMLTQSKHSEYADIGVRMSVDLSSRDTSDVLNIIPCAADDSHGESVQLYVHSDRISDERDRCSALSGRYPTYDRDYPFDAKQSLLDNEELQMIDDVYQWPTCDYSTYKPAGPNYANAHGGSYKGYRWVALKYVLKAFSHLCVVGDLSNADDVLIDVNINGTWHDVVDRRVQIACDSAIVILRIGILRGSLEDVGICPDHPCE